jgi:hypothetical protein
MLKYYLKCTNSEWKKRIEEHIEKSAPNFTFITKFGSFASRNRIQMFDSDGQWIQSIDTKGSGNG